MLTLDEILALWFDNRPRRKGGMLSFEYVPGRLPLTKPRVQKIALRLNKDAVPFAVDA